MTDTDTPQETPETATEEETAPVTEEEAAPETEEEAAPETEEEEPDKDAIKGLKVETEKVSDVEQRMDVEVPWDEVQKRLDEAYRELGKGVTLKGFRKGKVPKKMLQKLFAKHVDKELAQRLVQDSIEPALKEADIKPVGEPKFDFPQEGIVRDAPFKYSATMEILPEIEPKDYFGLEVTAQRGKITDDDVGAALMQKQRELTDYKAVEGRGTRTGDVLLLDVMGKLGGEPVDFENRTVELTEPVYNELVPGINEALTGISNEQEDKEADWELELELDVPGEGETTQKAELLVTIHDVKQKVVPELDDDFAKDTGDAETLEGLKQVLREKLMEQNEERARDEAKRLMVQEIIRRNDVPVVPAMVDRYLDQRLRLHKMLMGMDGNQPSQQDAALKEAMRPDAEEMVQSGLLLEAISDKEKVETTEEDLEKRLEDLATERGQNLARVRSEYEKDNGLDALRRRIREDKTLDLLTSKANIIIEESKEEPEQPAPAPAEAAEQTEKESEEESEKDSE